MPEANGSIIIAISCGDPQGVGPEVIAGAISEFDDPGVFFRIAGDQGLIAGAFERHGGIPPGVTISHCPYDPDGSPPPSAAGGQAALDALDCALDMVLDGEADTLVTAPISKQAVAYVLPGFRGHTGYLGERAGVDPLMLLVNGEHQRVFLATDHVPLRDVAAHITPSLLKGAIASAQGALMHLFGIRNPRLAVLGLNPHAGEGGELGREEIEVIVPTIKEMGGSENGVFGPFPADSFFGSQHEPGFDGVLAMYHDQGLAPFKSVAFGHGVNVSIGLPYLRTSPDHGTGFDIVGAGVASHSSMTAALQFAALFQRSGTTGGSK